MLEIDQLLKSEGLSHTRQMRGALIGEVSRRRNLWDVRSVIFKDKQKGDMDWHQVKEAQNRHFIEDVKKQWRNLRDSFQKRLKGKKRENWIQRERTPNEMDIFRPNSAVVKCRSIRDDEFYCVDPIGANTQGRKHLPEKGTQGNQQVLLSRICDQLDVMSQPQADHFDVFGAYVATMLRRIAARDQELADIAQAGLTEINQKFMDSMKKQAT
ncbi:unnamed protein product [Heligmosomoides polygyrus]|uniref:MADF domain-containing protein n=1 Tax=Heligmosomoides polygyrus TaxID=6339 RepID=A0A183GU25_HELPZ|nr:unnamed protein product [Heligmosomoides polygyrus]